MSETEFKILTHCGGYVDANLLEKGLYTSSTPHLYSKEETIESMIKRAMSVQDMVGHWHVSDKYFENLKMCELVSVIIAEKI